MSEPWGGCPNLGHINLVSVCLKSPPPLIIMIVVIVKIHSSKKMRKMQTWLAWCTILEIMKEKNRI